MKGDVVKRSFLNRLKSLPRGDLPGFYLPVIITPGVEYVLPKKILEHLKFEDDQRESMMRRYMKYAESDNVAIVERDFIDYFDKSVESGKYDSVSQNRSFCILVGAMYEEAMFRNMLSRFEDKRGGVDYVARCFLHRLSHVVKSAIRDWKDAAKTNDAITSDSIRDGLNNAVSEMHPKDSFGGMFFSGRAVRIPKQNGNELTKMLFKKHEAKHRRYGPFQLGGKGISKADDEKIFSYKNLLNISDKIQEAYNSFCDSRGVVDDEDLVNELIELQLKITDDYRMAQIRSEVEGTIDTKRCENALLVALDLVENGVQNVMQKISVSTSFEGEKVVEESYDYEDEGLANASASGSQLGNVAFGAAKLYNTVDNLDEGNAFVGQDFFDDWEEMDDTEGLLLDKKERMSSTAHGAEVDDEMKYCVDGIQNLGFYEKEKKKRAKSKDKYVVHDTWV